MAIETGITGTTENLFTIGDGTVVTDDGYKYLYAKVRDSYCPGLRWNEVDVQWEFSNDGYAWTAIGSGGGLSVPVSTDQYTVLQGDGAGWWTESSNLTLPNGANRTITIQPIDSSGNTLIISGHNSLTAGGDAGGLWLYGGEATGTGNGGGIQIIGGYSNGAPGDGGSVQIEGGLADDGTPADITIGGFSSSFIYIGGTSGSVVLGGSKATDVAFYSNSDTISDRAGIRYNDTTDRWQGHDDNGGATWYDFGLPSNPADGYQVGTDGSDFFWEPGYYNALYVGKPGVVFASEDGYLLPNLSISPDESFPAFLVPINSYFTQFRVNLGAPPGVGEWIIITIRASFSDTSLELMISDLSTSANDDTTKVLITQGNTISVRVQTSSGAAVEDISVVLLMFPTHAAF